MRFDDYITRAVDGDCLRALRAGRNFYVFGPPQTGKTRLRERMGDTLRASGLRVVEIDLAARGGGELYFDLSLACAVQFGLGDPARFWDDYRDLDPAERWQRYLQTVPAGGPVVLLIDSVEALLAGGHDIDAFFGALRPAKVVGRTPIVTCLFGAVERIDLGIDIRTASLGRSHTRTWFRTAVQLRPDPFTAEEAEVVLPRLETPGGDARALLDGIMDWTAGHPALTTVLVDAIAEGGPLMVSGSEADTVAATVDALLFDAELSSVPTFAAAEAWTDCADPGATARWWSRIRRDDRVDWKPGEEAQRQLRMAGLARVDGAVLRPTNRLLVEVFDQAWCDARTLGDGLAARAREWLERDQDPGHLLDGDLLRRASAWSEGRDIDPAISELIVASWVHARHSEQPADLAPPRIEVASAPPVSMTQTAPPGLIAAAPPGLGGAAPESAPRAPDVEPEQGPDDARTVMATPPGSSAALRWLAVAVAVMALVTAGLLAALLQSRGSVDRTIAALMGRTPAPAVSTSTSTAASRAGASSMPSADPAQPAADRVAALEAAIARTEARLDALEAGAAPTAPTDEARVDAPVGAGLVAAAAPAARASSRDGSPADAELTARANAAERAAGESRRQARAAAEREAAEREAAEARAAKARAEQRAEAKARRRAEKKAAERAARRKARTLAESRRAARRALEARQAAEAEAARRPGPVAPPSPANAVARQAPSYRRSLVRCKLYDLPLHLRVKLTVQSDGRVSQSAIAGGAVERVDAACVRQSARNFRFAPFSGSAVTATVDYRL